MRINKYIAGTGYCSRRAADVLIKAGKILLNDVPVKEMGTQVEPGKDVVRIKGGNVLRADGRKTLLMMNKPKGYICTKMDKHAKHTVYELLPDELQSLKTIGRLDKDTEGLLLFTNDGDLANRLAHPKYAKKKTYRVLVRGKIEEKSLDRLRKGGVLKAYKVQPAEVVELGYDKEKNRTKLVVTITEGKKRQIHNMFLSIKHPVKYLQRITFGPYKLGNLKLGRLKIIK